MRKYLLTSRTIGAVAIGLAVPLVIYLVNGAVEPWAYVLGATAGIAWFICPCSLPV